jgi:hypothetical protein
VEATASEPLGRHRRFAPVGLALALAVIAPAAAVTPPTQAAGHLRLRPSERLDTTPVTVESARTPAPGARTPLRLMLTTTPSPVDAAARAEPGASPPTTSEARTAIGAEEPLPGKTASATPGEYRDQLIAGVGPEEDSPIGALEEPGVGPPTAYGLTYRFRHDDVEGAKSVTEHGLSGYWTREHLDYGTSEVRLEGLTINGDARVEGDGGRFLLAQRGLVLPNEMIADAELGHLRATAGRLAASSYRLRLPSSLLAGTRARLQGRDGSLTVTAGGLGRLRGTVAQEFSLTGGTLIGGSAERRLGRAWRVGAELWNVNGAASVRDHTSVLAGPRTRQRGRTLRCLAGRLLGSGPLDPSVRRVPPRSGPGMERPADRERSTGPVLAR